MEKEIYRKHLTRGCVWVFMSMFDFKHSGGSNQKLLMDKKHGSKRIIGEMQSVKKLIEEEIDEKTKTRNRKKKRSSGNWSRTSEDNNILDANNDDAEKRNSDYDSEENFSELIKRLIAQKESEINIRCKSKNLADAFKELDSNEESRTIVILKPEENNNNNNSNNKVKNGRFGSLFLLSRIRRRLKSVVEKAPCNITQQDSDQEQDQTNSERHVSDKSMCGIYVTAKKHLSEMLAEGDVEVDLPDKEAPRILGKILALPEFSTPENSPRMIQQCSSEDEPLGLDSNKHEEEIEFTSDKSEEKTVIVVEDEHKQPLEQETFNEKHLPSSPPTISECQEHTTDVPGKSSPVSVLELFLTDDELSPYSSKLSSVETRMKPLCIRFDEPESPRLDKDNDVDEKELTLEYIQAVVKSSELNWEEILARSFYSDQLLEQALMEDIEFCSNNFCDDKKLLFDCINEVLTEFCANGPWISFVKPAVIANAIEVVQEEVYWYLLPSPSPHTLDQIVKKDLARSGRWMDIRFDSGFIGLEIGEVILDELLEEMISNFSD